MADRSTRVIRPTHMHKEIAEHAELVLKALNGFHFANTALSRGRCPSEVVDMALPILRYVAHVIVLSCDTAVQLLMFVGDEGENDGNLAVEDGLARFFVRVRARMQSAFDDTRGNGGVDKAEVCEIFASLLIFASFIWLFIVWCPFS